MKTRLKRGLGRLWGDRGLHFRIFLSFLTLIAATTACGLPDSTSQPQVVTVIVTAPPPPTAAPSPTPLSVATVGPLCTALQSLEFRSGPGAAYIPILGLVDAGVGLLPTGFNPAGVPDGTWVQVINLLNNQAGWVSAGAEFVQCNLDLTMLPVIAAQPTPTPSAPKVSNKPPEGPTNGDLIFDIVMDSNYLMQIQTRLKDSPNNGDGIAKVTFLIERDGETVYQQSETLAAFCIFKGGEPDCNPWPQTNGRSTWGADGPVVETGDYKATIRVSRLSNPNSFAKWTFNFTIDLP